MTVVSEKYVVRDLDRFGNVRWYFRRDGKKYRLPCGPGKPGFDEAYAAAARGEPIRLPRSPNKEKQGYLYFLRAGNAIKIGYSQNPMHRLYGLETGMPRSPDAIVIIKGTTQDEKRIHSAFQNLRTTGEWFRNCVAIRRAMARAAAHGNIDIENILEP